jgi:protein TonB
MPPPWRRPVAPGLFNPRSLGRAKLEDGLHKSESTNDQRSRSRSPRARSHALSFALSIAAHACAFAALLYFAPALERPHGDWVLAYLVEVGDGSSGGSASMRSGATAPSIPIRSDAGPLSIPERPKSHKPVHRSLAASRVDRERASDAPAAKLASLAPGAAAKSAPGAHSGSHSASKTGGASANASDGSGSGQGASDGNGDGDGGGSIAHADYGSNPPPPYPPIARRRDQQGTVTIRALVNIDGSVERAEIAESSGFDSLDNAALETVRRRWRFVPARRDGTPVESWVLVPIRFALTEANASR